MAEPGAPKGIGSWHFLRQHPALVASAVALTTVIVKLLMVAHGDPQAVASLLRSGGASNVVVATLLTGLPNVAWVALVWAVPGFGEAVRDREALFVPSVALLVTLAFVFILSPWRTALTVLLFLAFFLVTGIPFTLWDRRRGRERPPAVPRRRQAILRLVFGLILGWLAVVSSDRPWLPAEQLSLRQGIPVVGYVLTRDGEGLVVMRHSDRTVLRVDLSSVEKRIFCTSDREDSRSLLILVLSWERADYPPCAKPQSRRTAPR